MYEGSGNTDWSMLMLEVLLKMGRVTSPIVSMKALVTHLLLSTSDEGVCLKKTISCACEACVSVISSWYGVCFVSFVSWFIVSFSMGLPSVYVAASYFLVL